MVSFWLTYASSGRILQFGMLLFVLGVCLLATLAYCFRPDEIEIFQLQNELTSKYGTDIDLYKFLKLPKLKNSSSKEIIKNLRNLSKKYHPDKNRKYKKLYERLNAATQILSDDSRRKTYDYYLQNGFPNYDFSKGGFFFKRVQPKTWFLLFFIYVAASATHYVLLRLQNSSNKNRIEGFIQQCKEQDSTNGLGEKHLTFEQYEGAEPKEIRIRFGDVFIVEPDGNESLISKETVPDPSIYDCLFFKLPIWIWRFTIGRFFTKIQQNGHAVEEFKNPVAEPAKKTANKKGSIAKDGQKKMTLPNGNVVLSRKRG